MEKLPDELISIILKDYLDIAEIVKCRLISKRFRLVIDNYVSAFLSEIIVGNECAGIYSLYYVHQWSYEWTGSYLKGYWIYKSLDLFKAPLFQNLLANLRYLTCCVRNNDYEKLEYLNEFVKLEKLSLALECVPQSCQTLTLPNLKCFGCCLDDIELRAEDHFWLKKRSRFNSGGPRPINRIWSQIKPGCYLKLNSKVETLWLNNLEEVELCRPDQVTCLEVQLLDSKNLSELKNLRTLRCQAISFSNLNLLECLPSLKEIYVKSSRKNYRQTKVLLDHLIQQKVALSRDDVQIYFCDILLTRPFESYGLEKFFNSIDLTTGELMGVTEMQLQNYNQLADRIMNSCNLSGMFYCRVIHCLDERAISFASFFKKYPNILHLNVTEIKSEAIFLSFLKQCSYLNQLRFCMERITQTIIDRLPDCCPHLKKLYLRKIYLELDCRPLLKLNHVRNHYKYKQIPEDSEQIYSFILPILM